MAEETDLDREESAEGLRFPVRSCLLKAILEDERKLMDRMLNGASFPIYELCKNAMKCLSDLQHSPSFRNFPVQKCNCSSEEKKGGRLYERSRRTPESPSQCGN